eukprot:269858-Rhodomonas_salina.2
MCIRDSSLPPSLPASDTGGRARGNREGPRPHVSLPPRPGPLPSPGCFSVARPVQCGYRAGFQAVVWAV